jgi:predicted nucleic acid-binding protein
MSFFFDTNILVYAQQAGTKADRANELLSQGGFISVQVLNELANVLRKKFNRDWSDVEAVLGDVCDALEEPLPLTLATHRAAIQIARDHGLSFYDATIVASALEAGCSVLASEDLQADRAFGALTIKNPFL